MSGEGFGSVTMWGFSPAVDLQTGMILVLLQLISVGYRKLLARMLLHIE